jgi:hypothetical protein
MLKDRAQQVVLAVATFDVDGRLLVSQGGLMPCQTITRQFHQRVSLYLPGVVYGLTFSRHSTMNSTPRTLYSTGCSESPVTGPVL